MSTVKYLYLDTFISSPPSVTVGTVVCVVLNSQGHTRLLSLLCGSFRSLWPRSTVLSFVPTPYKTDFSTVYGTRHGFPSPSENSEPLVHFLRPDPSWVRELFNPHTGPQEFFPLRLGSCQHHNKFQTWQVIFILRFVYTLRFKSSPT